MSPKIPLLICLASTLYMTGVIWFVQVVHYPLFGRVGPDSFRAYHADHTRTTGYVVLVPMLLELGSAAWLVARGPEGAARSMAWLGLVLTLVSWASTFLLSVPAHNRLALGFDPATHRLLVGSNWIRLASWTGHSAVMLALVGRAIR